MLEHFKYLPHSGNRYLLNVHGEVFDEGGNLIKTVTNKTRKVVTLDWIFGRCDYEIGLLMIVTFNDLWLPDEKWLEIEPLYKDGDFTNTNLSNLSYRFRSLIDVKGHHGFYYVPFYTYYGINKDGVLINTVTGRVMTWWVTKPCLKRNSKGGYRSCRVVINRKHDSRMLFRHRALCLVFHPYDGNIDSLIVNHIDGVPGNDDINNITWSTYSKNNQHAYDNSLRPNACKAVLMKDLYTGLITRFQSISACARANGHEHGTYIRLRIINSKGRLFDDYKQFKFDDGSDWDYVDPLQTPCRISGMNVIARNVFTGQLSIFESASDAEEITGVKSETILNHVRKEVNIPINGFNFRLHNDHVNWPIHTGRHLLIYKDYPIKPSNGVIVTNVTDGTEKFFTSCKNACKEYGLSKSKLASLMNNGLMNGVLKFECFNIKDYGPRSE